MSAEEINNVTETEPVNVSPEEPDQKAPETTATMTEPDDADWDDVPEPEEDEREKEKDKSTAEVKADQSTEKDAGKDGGLDDNGDENDPYSFLYEEGAEELHENANDKTYKTDKTYKENARLSDESDKSDGAETDEAARDAGNAETETLDSLKVDELISGLPDGELKDFADNYPEETKMAAAMAIQVLKKLGFDKLRGDMARYSGTAEEYARNQAELAAYAAQQEFERAVLKIHPDATEIIAGKDRNNFAGWLKNQPKFIQKRFRDCNDPEEAADILSRYKETRGAQKQEQQKRTAKIQGVKASSAMKRSADKDDADWDDVPEPEDF
ncbi:MAG: hypothetical protein J5858_15240 [Lentisphaeria bacterium]|nr:hypothetical protein [Lentisphaeria bacterium]